MSGIEPEYICISDDESDFEPSSKSVAQKRPRENLKENHVKIEAPEEKKPHDNDDDDDVVCLGSKEKLHDDDIVYPSLEEKPRNNTHPSAERHENGARERERLPMLVEAVQESSMQIYAFTADLQANLLESIDLEFTELQKEMNYFFYMELIHTKNYNANYKEYIKALEDARAKTAGKYFPYNGKEYDFALHRQVGLILDIIDFFIRRVKRQYKYYLRYVKHTEDFLRYIGVLDKKKDEK